MKEYNYDEVRQMQEKALERVHDMNLRAQKAMGLTDNGVSNEAKKEVSSPSDFYSAVKSSQNGNRIAMPVELPDNKPYSSFKEYFEPENKRIRKEAEKSNKADLLDTVLNEPDKALLFALLLLLQSDGADEELLMSILYIML